MHLVRIKVHLSRDASAGEVGSHCFAFATCRLRKPTMRSLLRRLPPGSHVLNQEIFVLFYPSSPCAISFLTLHPMQRGDESIDIFGRVVEGQ